MIYEIDSSSSDSMTCLESNRSSLVCNSCSNKSNKKMSLMKSKLCPLFGKRCCCCYYCCCLSSDYYNSNMD